MPVTEGVFKKLPDIQKAHEGAGYPSIFIHDGKGTHITLTPRRIGQRVSNGLPILPFIVKDVGDEEPLTNDDVLVEVRRLWNQAKSPSIFTLEEWKERTEIAPVATTEVFCENRWPLVKNPVEKADEERQSSEEGKGKASIFSPTWGEVMPTNQ